MPFHPQIPDKAFAFRLAVFYAALFAGFGIQLPFFPLWLAAKGLDAQLIGIVLAIPMVVRVFAIHFAARAADRREALRLILMAASVAAAGCYAAMGFSEGAPAIILISVPAAAFATPLMPLTEAYALRGLTERKRAYGPVRVWGSGAFIAGMLVAGSATDLMSARHLIWLIVAGSALTALTAFWLAPLQPDAPHPEGRPPSPSLLLRQRGFIALLVGAGLIQASHAVYYAFSTLQWTGAGLDGKAVAVLWGIGVVSEIVLFALSGRFPPWLTPAVLLMIGAGGGVLRWTIMAFDPPVAALPFLQGLHAASFGCTHLGALSFVQRAAPPGLATTAQGYLAITLGILMAAATGLSGVLYARFGGQAYLAMALAALAGGACAYGAQRSGRHAVRT